MGLLNNSKTAIHNFIGSFSPDKDVERFIPKYRNIFGFYGVKAGLGVSSFIACLADELATKGLRVGILDFNFDMPVVASFFSETPYSQSIHKLASGSHPINDFLIEYQNKKEKKIYTCSPASHLGLREYWNLGIEGFEGLLSTFSERVDVLLIDIPSDLNYETFHLGMSLSFKVYSFTDDSPRMIAQLSHVRNQLSNFGDFKYVNPGAIRDIIFANILEIQFSEADLKKYGFNLIGILPFDAELNTHFKNASIPTFGKKGNTSIYKDTINTISTDILNIIGGAGSR